jgi:cytochrome P450
MKTTKEYFIMSNYYMSSQQRKALNQAMNRQVAQSYERLLDLCNERFDENHEDPKLAALNKRLNDAAVEVEDLILSIWDCSDDDEQDQLSKEEIALIKEEIANEFDEE